MKPDKFGPLIGALMAATGAKLSVTDIEAWRRLLADLPDKELAAALTRAACECVAFPSVALIRRLAGEAAHGRTEMPGEAWERVLRCVRTFGFYQREKAREELGPLAWAACGGDVGWEHLCDMETDQRTHYAAQFRQRWEAGAGEESRVRALPASLVPRVNNQPVREIPEAPPQRKALPAPPQPTAAQIDKAKLLRVFRDPSEVREQSPEEVARVKAEQAAKVQQLVAAKGT